MIRYILSDKIHSTSREVAPIVYEDAMHPGQMKSLPVKRTETAETITLESGFDRVEIPKSALADGTLELREEEFTPQLPPHRKNPCNPCTGCGACSY